MSLNLIATYVSWQFLPPLATSTLIRALDGSPSLLPGGLWRPSSTSPEQARRNQQLARTLIIVGYLLWNAWTSTESQGLNWYQVLGVGVNVDESGLKNAARQAARRYHPDKVGEEGSELFQASRIAFDTLSSPVKRFAYDRFGAKVIAPSTAWSKCSTERGHMMVGLEGMAIWYAMTAAVQFLMWYLSAASRQGQGLRLYLFVALFTIEMSLLVSEPDTGPLRLFRAFLPSRCIFQHIDLLRQLWVSASLAINQLLPVWMPAGDIKSPTPEEEERLKVVLRRSLIMARELELNDARALEQEVQALTRQGAKDGVSGEEIQRLVKQSVEACTSDALLSRQPTLQQVWADVEREVDER